MTTVDLHVDPKLRRNLTKANAAFSKVEYPSAVEVIDVLVLHRVKALLDECSVLIRNGEATLRTLFLNWLNTDPNSDEAVTLLEGSLIYSLGEQLEEEKIRPTKGGRLENVLAVVKDSLAKRGLLKALDDIGIEVKSYHGGVPVRDVIYFGDA